MGKVSCGEFSFGCVVVPSFRLLLAYISVHEKLSEKKGKNNTGETQ